MFIIIRIIAGKNKGFIIKTKEGMTTRPTLNRVRENIFNIIRGKVPGSLVLDLFAGSGAIGLESLSRGASKAFFIEKDRLAYNILLDNLTKTGNIDKGICYHRSYEAFLKTCCEKFDIIYVDPPYHLDCYLNVLSLVGKNGLLKEDGILILESRKDKDLPLETDYYECYRHLTYGNTKIWLYKEK